MQRFLGVTTSSHPNPRQTRFPCEATSCRRPITDRRSPFHRVPRRPLENRFDRRAALGSGHLASTGRSQQSLLTDDIRCRVHLCPARSIVSDRRRGLCSSRFQFHHIDLVAGEKTVVVSRPRPSRPHASLTSYRSTCQIVAGHVPKLGQLYITNVRASPEVQAMAISRARLGGG